MITEHPAPRKKWSERRRSHPKPAPASRPDWRRYNPPADAAAILEACPNLFVANTTAELLDAACGTKQSNSYEVAYKVEGKGRVVDATVARVRNGIGAN